MHFIVVLLRHPHNSQQLINQQLQQLILESSAEALTSLSHQQ